MATIRREIHIAVPPEQAWDAVRDLGSLHTRLVPGFVTDCRMDGPDARVVTFGNGLVVRELIVAVDDAARRVAWSAQSERMTHHNASLQILPERDGCRAVWIADLLPHGVADAIAAMIDAGMAAMKRALEGGAR